MRDRKHWDPELYKAEIELIDWTDLLQSTDITYIYSRFEEEILKILNKMAPIKTFQARKQSNNWISQQLKDDMKDRNSLRLEAQKSGLKNDWDKYKIARNSVVKKLRKCKDNYLSSLYDKLESEKDTKGLYNLTHRITGRKTASIPQQFII